MILRSIGGLDYYLGSFELLNYSFENAYRKRLTSHIRKVSFGENLDRLQLGLWNKKKNLLVFVSNYNWLGPTGAVISAQHKPPLLTVGAALNKVRRNAKSLPLSYCYCRYYYTHASTQENLVEREGRLVRLSRVGWSRLVVDRVVRQRFGYAHTWN